VFVDDENDSAGAETVPYPVILKMGEYIAVFAVMLAKVGLETVAMSCIVLRVDEVNVRLVLFTLAEVSALLPFEQVRVLAVRPERVVVTNVGEEVVAMSWTVFNMPPENVRLVLLTEAEAKSLLASV